MCEILALKSDSTFYLAEVIPYAAVMEKYGIAGFGWGVAWLAGGELKCFRSVGKIQEDVLAHISIGKEKTSACLFHLRRPSFLGTISLENTQPFVEAGRFAFAHNGFFAGYESVRRRLAGELKGDSDSEVGFRFYAERLRGMPPDQAILKTVDDLTADGSANVVTIHAGGDIHAVARNRANQMFSFRGAGYRGIVTELHSHDHTLFRKFFTWIEEVQPVSGCTSM